MTTKLTLSDFQLLSTLSTSDLDRATKLDLVARYGLYADLDLLPHLTDADLTDLLLMHFDHDLRGLL